MRKTKKQADKSQGEAFIEAARALGCDEDPARFDEALKKVARHKPRAQTEPERDVEEKDASSKPHRKV